MSKPATQKFIVPEDCGAIYDFAHGRNINLNAGEYSQDEFFNMVNTLCGAGPVKPLCIIYGSKAYDKHSTIDDAALKGLNAMIGSHPHGATNIKYMLKVIGNTATRGDTADLTSAAAVPARRLPRAITREEAASLAAAEMTDDAPPSPSSSAAAIPSTTKRIAPPPLPTKGPVVG